MEEKIIIKSKNYNLKKFVKNVFIVSVVLGLVFSLFYIISTISNRTDDYNEKYLLYCKHTDDIVIVNDGSYFYREFYVYGVRYDDRDEAKEAMVFLNHDSALSYAVCGEDLFLWSIVSVFFFVAGLMIPTAIIYFWLSKVSLTVTDRRIYGTAAFGKRVDIPIDKVSAFGTSWLKGISISSSSGRIVFKLIKNQNEVHEALGKMFVERENVAEKTRATSAPASAPVIDTADQLQKFKSLLDNGVITQEEFDAKKKELLGL